MRVGEEPRLPINVAANAISILNAFLEAKEVRRCTVTDGKEARMVASWCPPLTSMAKVNADAAFFGELGVGVGTLLRDHEGVLIGLLLLN